jgi:uncharacterized protein (DUF952 family)
VIYHITTKSEWEAAQKNGRYEAPSLQTEGFIHCSKAEQVPGVLDRYYAGIKNLIKLTIDPSKLTSGLKYEMAPSVNEAFPHVFGPINLEAVVKVEAL